MRLPHFTLSTLALLLLGGVLVGSQEGRPVQGQNGRMQSRRAHIESQQAREREMRYRKREQQVLNRRVAELHRRSQESRARLLREQQEEKNRWRGNVLNTFRQRCGTCHPYPDTYHATDRAWLERVPLTSCAGMQADSRETLARYLTSIEGLQPRTLSSEPRPEPDRTSVTTSISAGEVFLRHQGGPVFRLVWSRGQEGERRSIPTGNYQVLGYRLFGGVWTAAAAGGKRQLVAAPGETLHLALDPRIRAELAHERRREQVTVTLTLRGQDGMGVALYEGGATVTIPVFVTEGAEVFTQSKLRSVGQGRFRATFAAPQSLQDAGLRVEWPAGMPFQVTGALTMRL